jgi:hypothetical protein
MAGEVALRKRLRMTLDLEVVVEELTDEYLREYYRLRTNYEQMVGDFEIWANVSRQRLLQRALLEDAEALRRYLVYVATAEVDPSPDGGLGELFGVEEERAEEEILGSVLGRLSGEDAAYFRESIEGKVLFEATEALSHSFRVRWVGGVLEEVRVVGEGEPHATESDDHLM